MASLAYVEREINALPVAMRPVFIRIFQSILRDLRFGHPKGEQPDPSVNFGGGFFDVTTAAAAGDEFTIPHGFGRTPYLLVPVMPLDVVGAQIVPLENNRVADDKRVYLTSTAESADICCYIEG